jgi:hypothetical protein
MPTKRRKVPPRHIGATPAWAQRLLEGEMPEIDTEEHDLMLRGGTSISERRGRRMPTKRRRRAPITIGLSAAAIEAWRVGDAGTLRGELGIKPWEYEPWLADVYSGVDPDDPPADPYDHRGWERAVALQRALMAICRPGKVGRHGLPLGPAED